MSSENSNVTFAENVGKPDTKERVTPTPRDVLVKAGFLEKSRDRDSALYTAQFRALQASSGIADQNILLDKLTQLAAYAFISNELPNDFDVTREQRQIAHELRSGEPLVEKMSRAVSAVVSGHNRGR